jgi:hypothetical protein
MNNNLNFFLPKSKNQNNLMILLVLTFKFLTFTIFIFSHPLIDDQRQRSGEEGHTVCSSRLDHPNFVEVISNFSFTVQMRS